jgi:RNA polymerase sigma-70 factor (ECF subfamily)
MAAVAMPLSDEQLIRQHQSAPMQAIHAEELFRRYSARVTAWCWRFAGDRDAAQDLAQEVLMKAYLHLGSFRSDAKFSTWLYSITRNHCLNYVRTQKRQPLDVSEPLEENLADREGWDTLAAMEREAAVSTIRTLVMQSLDETETQVMMLHYAEELPLGAITQMLALKNASGAKAFIVSAKRKLAVAFRRMNAQQSRRAN